jgi:hypothetical protein
VNLHADAITRHQRSLLISTAWYLANRDDLATNSSFDVDRNMQVLGIPPPPYQGPDITTAIPQEAFDAIPYHDAVVGMHRKGVPVTYVADNSSILSFRTTYKFDPKTGHPTPLLLLLPNEPQKTTLDTPPSLPEGFARGRKRHAGTPIQQPSK